MARIAVAKVSDIPPGQREIVVPFRGRAGIGVFNVAGIVLRGTQYLPPQERPALHGHTHGSGDDICAARRARGRHFH